MRARRATTAEDREARRRSLVDAAEELLEHWSIEDVSMNRVADRAGVAKGTVYLYFATREELLIAVWEREHASWLEAVSEIVRRSDGTVSDRHLVDAVVETALARPRLCRFHGIVDTVLAANLTLAAAREFSKRRMDRAAATAALLDRRGENLSAPRALRWLLSLDAIMAGLLPLAAPSPAVARALEDPGLRSLRFDVEVELRLIAAATLAGRRKA